MAERVAIGPDATAGEMTDRLSRLGADLMARALAALSRGGLSFTPQAAEGVTYAKKIDKGETRIDWSRPAAEVHNHIRGLSPDPGAWFEADFGKGPERIKVLRSTLAEGGGAPGALIGTDLTVACGDGRRPPHRGPARRQAAGEGRGLPARRAARARPAAALGWHGLDFIEVHEIGVAEALGVVEYRDDGRLDPIDGNLHLVRLREIEIFRVLRRHQGENRAALRPGRR